MDILAGIRTSYQRRVEAGLFDGALLTWRQEQPALGAFETFADLLKWMGSKNSVPVSLMAPPDATSPSSLHTRCRPQLSCRPPTAGHQD